MDGKQIGYKENRSFEDGANLENEEVTNNVINPSSSIETESTSSQKTLYDEFNSQYDEYDAFRNADDYGPVTLHDLDHQEQRAQPPGHDYLSFSSIVSPDMKSFDYSFDDESPILPPISSENLEIPATKNIETTSMKIATSTASSSSTTTTTSSSSKNSSESKRKARSNVSSEPQSCIVCNDFASGRHYGIVSCEGCKGFFRRAILHMTRKERPIIHHHNGIENIYKCIGKITQHACIITSDQGRRRCCKSCRFQKCVQKGMKYDPDLPTGASDIGVEGGQSKDGRQYDAFRFQYHLYRAYDIHIGLLAQKVVIYLVTVNNSMFTSADLTEKEEISKDPQVGEEEMIPAGSSSILKNKKGRALFWNMTFLLELTQGQLVKYTSHIPSFRAIHTRLKMKLIKEAANRVVMIVLALIYDSNPQLIESLFFENSLFLNDEKCHKQFQRLQKQLETLEAKLVDILGGDKLTFASPEFQGSQNGEEKHNIEFYKQVFDHADQLTGDADRSDPIFTMIKKLKEQEAEQREQERAANQNDWNNDEYSSSDSEDDASDNDDNKKPKRTMPSFGCEMNIEFEEHKKLLELRSKHRCMPILIMLLFTSSTESDRKLSEEKPEDPLDVIETRTFETFIKLLPLLKGATDDSLPWIKSELSFSSFCSIKTSRKRITEEAKLIEDQIDKLTASYTKQDAEVATEEFLELDTVLTTLNQLAGMLFRKFRPYYTL